MAGLKFVQSYLRESEHGLPSGCCLLRILMEDGLKVEKLTFWSMLVLNRIPYLQLYIRVHIKGTQKGKTIYLDSATKGFNVYALEWDEAEIKAYVNGILYFKFSDNGSGSAYWPYNRPFYLILNLAIGGGLGGKKGIDDSAFPNFMDVDYVRVYQRR